MDLIVADRTGGKTKASFFLNTHIKRKMRRVKTAKVIIGGEIKNVKSLNVWIVYVFFFLKDF
jgi:F0F1-type ATP synthase alpha subunit